jgi:hypothetical protein
MDFAKKIGIPSYDINVLQRLPLFGKLAMGELPPVEFQANGNHMQDGLLPCGWYYPKRATFVKPLVKP